MSDPALLHFRDLRFVFGEMERMNALADELNKVLDKYPASRVANSNVCVEEYTEYKRLGALICAMHHGVQHRLSELTVAHKKQLADMKLTPEGEAPYLLGWHPAHLRILDEMEVVHRIHKRMFP